MNTDRHAREALLAGLPVLGGQRHLAGVPAAVLEAVS
jgi:hypothetical protein